MTSKQLMRFIGTMVFVACVLPAQAQQAPDPRVADLVQSGKLRIALGLGSPVLATKDPKSGQVSGPALDLARMLARYVSGGSFLPLRVNMRHANANPTNSRTI